MGHVCWDLVRERQVAQSPGLFLPRLVLPLPAVLLSLLTTHTVLSHQDCVAYSQCPSLQGILEAAKTRDIPVVIDAVSVASPPHAQPVQPCMAPQ